MAKWDNLTSLPWAVHVLTTPLTSVPCQWLCCRTKNLNKSYSEDAHVSRGLCKSSSTQKMQNESGKKKLLKKLYVRVVILPLLLVFFPSAS
ncbi:hypothetical protein V8E55_001126 [Tylopilus felleus]